MKKLLLSFLLVSTISTANASASEEFLAPTIQNVNLDMVDSPNVSADDPVLKVIVGVRSTVPMFLGAFVNTYYCTGTIIAEHVIVTAAHCADYPNSTEVTFGTDMNHPTASFTVDKMLVNSLYNSDTDLHDIALMHFKEDLPSGFHAAPILPSTLSLHAGDRVVTAGYGANRGDGDQGMGTLRKNTLTVSNPDYASDQVSIDQSHGPGACHGDSGGPTFTILNGEYYVWGVTSFATSNDCSRQAVMIDIDKDMSFVREGLARLSN